MIFILLIVIFSCSNHFLNWNCFSISSFMNWYFCVKFGSLLFKSSFLICFFKFIPNYFGWLGILNCHFFHVCFLCCDSALWFESWTGLASGIFNYFKKISFIIIEFVENWYSLFFFILLWIRLFFSILPFNLIFNDI